MEDVVPHMLVDAVNEPWPDDAIARICSEGLEPETPETLHEATPGRC